MCKLCKRDGEEKQHVGLQMGSLGIIVREDRLAVLKRDHEALEFIRKTRSSLKSWDINGHSFFCDVPCSGTLSPLDTLAADPAESVLKAKALLAAVEKGGTW